MSVIFVLIIISVLVAGGFLAAFFWAVRDGQFEDDYTPAVRILFDDATTTPYTPDSDSSTNSSIDNINQ